MSTAPNINMNQAVTGAVTAGGNLAITAARGGSGQQIALQLPALGVSAVGIAAASGVGWAAAAIPFIGPVVAGVTLGLSALFARQSGKQKVAATQIVDQAEPLLAENVSGYLANPTPEAQQQALGNFDYVWGQIISPEFCGNPQLGSAGQRCVSERQAGGRWDWFALYRDPIANTSPTAPSVVSSNRPNDARSNNAGQNPNTASGDAQQSAFSQSGGGSPIVVLGLVVAGLYLLMGDK